MNQSKDQAGFSIRDYGATGDGQSLDTPAIQAAIDSVANQGGGKVVIPAGKWLTGRISLKSNVNLHITEGAELTFSGDVADYRPALSRRIKLTGMP